MRPNRNQAKKHSFAVRLGPVLLACFLASCAATPKPVSDNASRTQAMKACNELDEVCESSLEERYRYYLGMLSVYLIGLNH